MRKLMLAGAALLALSAPAKADLVWQFTDLENVLSDAPNNNLFSITGNIITDDAGLFLASNIMVTFPSPIFAGSGDFLTADGATEMESGGQFHISDSSATDQFYFFPNGNLDTPGATVPLIFLSQLGWAFEDGNGSTDFFTGIGSLTEVPEPSALAMFGLGLCGVTMARRKKRVAI